MTCHRVRASANKPALTVLPIDPITAKFSALSRASARRDHTDEAKRVLERMQQIRRLLHDGPMALPAIVQALQVPTIKVKWAIRRLAIAGEIETLQRRWQLVAAAARP